MRKKGKDLTVKEVEKLAKTLPTGKVAYHAVGGAPGLLLRVSRNKAGDDVGGVSWIARLSVGDRINRKGEVVPYRQDHGLGSYGPAGLTLSEARTEALELRKRLRRGEDVLGDKKAARRAKTTEIARRMTFAQAATQCHKFKSKEFRNEKHAAQWLQVIETYANPVIGHMPVEAVETEDIQRLLEPIWETKTETAKRVRQRVEVVFRWAFTKKKLSRENPARWEGNLKELMPNPAKIQKRRNFPALPVKEMGGFIPDLKKRKGEGARALLFTILTATRSGEVRGMTWEEIDLDKKLWRIPGDRMKAGKPHTVPLSDAALEILGDPGKGLVFTATRGGMLSDMTLAKPLKTMREEGTLTFDAVPHGFRSTFKDWAREYCPQFPDEVSELALAHINSDATRAAYARSELIEPRTRLMERWAKFLSMPYDKWIKDVYKPEQDNVTPIRGEVA